MRSLEVLLACTPEGLVDESIRLQRVLKEVGTFKINYQSGSYAQFFVSTNCCATHLERALHKLGFEVEVRDNLEEIHIEEVCHDCQTMAT